MTTHLGRLGLLRAWLASATCWGGGHGSAGDASTSVAFVYSLYHLGEYLFIAPEAHHLHHLYFEARSTRSPSCSWARCSRHVHASHVVGSASPHGRSAKTVHQPPLGEVITLPVSEVEPGMELRALPRESFAVDGEVISGESMPMSSSSVVNPFPWRRSLARSLCWYAQWLGDARLSSS